MSVKSKIYRGTIGAGIAGAMMLAAGAADARESIRWATSSTGSYGYMVDSTGMIVAHPDPELRMNLNVTEADSAGFEGANALGREFLSGETGVGEVRSPEGERVTMIWNPIQGTDWVLAASVPNQVFTQVTHNLLRSLLLAGLVILVALLMIVGMTARRSLKPIGQTARALADIAQGKGDLTRRLPVDSQDEVGELAKQFNAFVERMQLTLREVRGSARTVLSGASEMADGAQELSSRTEQAAANLQETSASMEEIHSTVSHTSQASEQANGLSTDAAATAARGNEAMAQMEAKMAAINESAGKISEIISLIDSIAFQTNILALNASVEAARAGEHGRGFAVVAQEVRNLASRSADAAHDIRELIDASVTNTREGGEIVKGVAERMQEIHQSITQVSDVIGEITAGAREQTSGIEQVNTAVAEMDTMTQQNAAMVNQNAGLAATMRDNARRLDTLMSEFVLGDAPAGRKAAPQSGSRPVAALPPAPPTKPASANQPEPEWEAF